MPDHRLLLQSAGLTPSESRVYLASLSFGPMTVIDLAKRATLSRPSTYAAIEALTAKGLMSSFLRGKRSLYTAEPPERLRGFVESEARKLQGKVGEIVEAIPDLKLLQRGERPSVKFFEGIEGLRAIAEDLTATKPDTTDEIANLDAVKDIFAAEELQKVRQVLITIKTRGRALLSGDVTAARPGVVARVLPKNTFNFFGDIVIYGNKIAMLTFKGKLLGVVIENSIIADTYRVLFDLAWQGAAPFPEIKG